MHITGEVKFKTFKTQGEKIKKGALLAELVQKDKLLRIFSPISGDIVDANPVLNDNPELLNEDPYQKGWMYEIRPTNWIADTNPYHIGEGSNKLDWKRTGNVQGLPFNINKEIRTILLSSHSSGWRRIDRSCSFRPSGRGLASVSGRFFK